jgi:hypothetical protein
MAIAELGSQISADDPFHIVDTTTFGLFEYPHRRVEVISSRGRREFLGRLVQRPHLPGTRTVSPVIDQPVFAPNAHESWGLVGPVVEWMRVHGVEIEP